jgi:hypothetical protein
MQMVRDAYANYVVQTTLDVVPESSDERKLLVHELNEHSEELVRCSLLFQEILSRKSSPLTSVSFPFAAPVHLCQAHCRQARQLEWAQHVEAD